MTTTRVAIVGTAPSWQRTPWNDPGLQVWGLNDAYRLRWPRADAWYDIHPIDKFHYVDGQTPVYAHQVPPGHYVRPSGHLDWLRKQTIPVWLQGPTVPDGWLHAKPLPKAQIEAHFGRYFTSTPAWMLAHAILLGATEIHIYGIHLATEHEYIEQRPNFEFLIGRVLGRGAVRQMVHDGVRTYESAAGRVVIPSDSPILQSGFQYGYETRPRAHLEPVKWELHKLQVKHARALSQLKTRKWWQPVSSTQAEIRYLEAAMMDTEQQLQRLQLAAEQVA